LPRLSESAMGASVPDDPVARWWTRGATARLVHDEAAPNKKKRQDDLAAS
jgi:hypothetical protein